MYLAPELLVFNQLDELRNDAAGRRLALAVRRAHRQARRDARRKARQARGASDITCSYAAAHAGGPA